MGIITPITNLLPLEISRPNGSDIEPQPVEKVERTPRNSDETYSPSNQESAGAAEEDGREAEASADDSEGFVSDDETDLTSQPIPNEPGHRINLLA